MKKPVRPDLVPCEINVTPLVDACLVLLILLVVVNPMLGGTSSLNRPGTRHPQPIPEDTKALVVVLHPDGSLWVEGQPVEGAALPGTLQQLRAEKPARRVIVKADRRLRYRQVTKILQAVETAGFRGAALSTERAE